MQETIRVGVLCDFTKPSAMSGASVVRSLVGYLQNLGMTVSVGDLG
jgi:hypothetical protein